MQWANMLTYAISFLPFTVDFHEKEQSERRPSPPARVPSKLSNELPLRTSTPSLLTGQTPGATPSISEAEELFSKFGLGSQKSHLATPGNPHSLVRSDGNLSEFARQAVFNQPKSRAGPLPSDSLQDFAKAYEEVQRQRTKKQSKTSPKSRATSRGGSSDRSFSGKEWTVEAALNGNGGLTNAMREGIETHGYDITWVGTIGFPTDSLSDTLKDDISDKLLEEYQSSVVYVGDSDFKGCYKGFCKTILWPHLHYSASPFSVPVFRFSCFPCCIFFIGHLLTSLSRHSRSSEEQGLCRSLLGVLRAPQPGIRRQGSCLLQAR